MINPQTQLFGVIGDPITHSASPLIHNYTFQQLQFDGAYMAFHITSNQLKDCLNSLQTLGFKGINVTIPHKETILNHCTHIDKHSAAIGAANTIVISNEGFHAYNTDGIGFIYALKNYHNVSLTNKNITIIGAGGSAKAIAVACLSETIKSLTIINRSKTNADHLLTMLKKQPHSTTLSSYSLDSDKSLDSLKKSDIVINTTPLGMAPHINNSPLTTFDWVTKNHTCYDIIYNPSKTLFLQKAAEHGAKTFNGASMLAAQAMYAFKHFTTLDAPFKHFINPLIKKQ